MEIRPLALLLLLLLVVSQAGKQVFLSAPLLSPRVTRSANQALDLGDKGQCGTGLYRGGSDGRTPAPRSRRLVPVHSGCIVSSLLLLLLLLLNAPIRRRRRLFRKKIGYDANDSERMEAHPPRWLDVERPPLVSWERFKSSFSFSRLVCLCSERSGGRVLWLAAASPPV